MGRGNGDWSRTGVSGIPISSSSSSFGNVATSLAHATALPLQEVAKRGEAHGEQEGPCAGLALHDGAGHRHIGAAEHAAIGGFMLAMGGPLGQNFAVCANVMRSATPYADVPAANTLLRARASSVV